MKKMHVVLIIVSVLIILSIVGFFIFKYLNIENDDWIYGSGEEQSEEMIFIVVEKKDKNNVMNAIMEKAGINSDAQTFMFTLPVVDTAK